MAMQFRHFLYISPVVVLALLAFSGDLSSGAKQYIVGGEDYLWSIPLTDDFYTNWSSSLSFFIGDTLLFDFDPELHNLFQVSRREYDSCTADRPFKVYGDSPAIVPLVEDGVFYFVCTISSYCSLGQKLMVTVQKTPQALAPNGS